MNAQSHLGTRFAERVTGAFEVAAAASLHRAGPGRGRRRAPRREAVERYELDAQHRRETEPTPTPPSESQAWADIMLTIARGGRGGREMACGVTVSQDPRRGRAVAKSVRCATWRFHWRATAVLQNRTLEVRGSIPLGSTGNQKGLAAMRGPSAFRPAAHAAKRLRNGLSTSLGRLGRHLNTAAQYHQPAAAIAGGGRPGRRAGVHRGALVLVAEGRGDQVACHSRPAQGDRP
jgi:hypothetical protein